MLALPPECIGKSAIGRSIHWAIEKLGLKPLQPHLGLSIIEASYFLDEIREEQEISEQSIARGLQAIETDPTDPWGYRDLATGLAIQGQLEQGLTFLESHT